MLGCWSASQLGRRKPHSFKTSLPVPPTSLQGLSEMGSLGISSVFIPDGTIRPGWLGLWSARGIGENVLSLKTINHQPPFLLASLPVFPSRPLSLHALSQRTLERLLDLPRFFIEAHEAAQILRRSFINCPLPPSMVGVRRRGYRTLGWSRPGVQLAAWEPYWHEDFL